MYFPQRVNAGASQRIKLIWTLGGLKCPSWEILEFPFFKFHIFWGMLGCRKKLKSKVKNQEIRMILGYNE